jgi:hypothetical protein
LIVLTEEKEKKKDTLLYIRRRENKFMMNDAEREVLCEGIQQKKKRECFFVLEVVQTLDISPYLHLLLTVMYAP